LVSSLLVFLLDGLVNYFGDKDTNIKDIRISRWYLINGLFFHTLYDFCTGFFHCWPLMRDEYYKIDYRVLDVWAPRSMPMTLCVWLEGLVMGPLCLILFFGIRLRKAKNEKKKESMHQNMWIFVIEIIVAVLQITGYYVWYGSEIVGIYTRETKLIVDWNFEFTFEMIFYFWFAFVFLPLVWVFVPLYLIFRAYGNITRTVKSLATTPDSKGKKKK